jgi:uncharacterized membrane protein
MRPWGIWLFMHLVGVVIWMGGMFTLSIWTARARGSGDPQVIAFAYALADRVYRRMIAVAAAVTVVAGGILMVVTERPWFRMFPEHWLFQMQVVGLLALLATLFIILPNAGRLALITERGIDTDDDRLEFADRVKRQAIVGSLIGTLLGYLVLIGALRI